MFNKPLKSRLQNVLEVLAKRTKLTGEMQKSLDRLISGYEGELKFSKALETMLHNNPIPLFNLCLKISGSECQIDSLLIFQNELILFEVKNHQGDFLIKNDNWYYTLSKEEIGNPLHQLHRTDLLLRQFLKEHQSPLNLRSFIIFTHPGFHLYQAPIDIPIVFPTQLKRFIQQLQNIPCRIEKRHHDLASLFKSRHETSSLFETIPTYNYTSLQKGVTCKRCDGFKLIDRLNTMRCTKCGMIENLEEAIMRNIIDFHTLFPDEKIKVRTIENWINNCISKFRIRSILSRHCDLVAKGKKSHYLLNKMSEKPEANFKGPDYQ